MIKLQAAHSQKKSENYDSRGFSASIEVELADHATAAEIQERLAKAYDLLQRSVEQQFAGSDSAHGLNNGNPINRLPHKSKNGNGNGRKASVAQVKAVYGIGKGAGLSKPELLQYVEERFGVSKPEQLSVRDASSLIEDLKQLVEGRK